MCEGCFQGCFRFRNRSNHIVSHRVSSCEFWLILATAALSREIIDDHFMAVVVLSAVLTMALTPLTMAGGTRVIDRLTRRFRFLRPCRRHRIPSTPYRLPRRGHQFSLLVEWDPVVAPASHRPVQQQGAVFCHGSVPSQRYRCPQPSSSP